MKIENLSQFRGKMRLTTVTERGEIVISVGPNKYEGTICLGDGGYYVNIAGYHNSKLFELAEVDKLKFVENVLGYTDKGDGDWPWMKSKDDVLKVLVELDRLYLFQAPEIEKPKSMEMEMEHPSIEDIDFTPKKKHYSFNFQM